MMDLDRGLDSLANGRERLLSHPVYTCVDSLSSLRLFMQEHVFAVWDFMSLLKRMQQLCTSTQVPWTPARDARLARFINEIVLGEECDDDGRGGYISHFELYLEAMDELGADTIPIRDFVSRLELGGDPFRLLDQAPIQQTTRDFVRFTLQICRIGQPHEVAAAFCYGREDIIPEMFTRLLPSLQAQGRSAARLEHYLKRHIELDGDEHGPLARAALEHLCHHDSRKEAAALATASRALEARIRLWDGVLAALRS